MLKLSNFEHPEYRKPDKYRQSIDNTNRIMNFTYNTDYFCLNSTDIRTDCKRNIMQFRELSHFYFIDFLIYIQLNKKF